MAIAVHFICDSVGICLSIANVMALMLLVPLSRSSSTLALSSGYVMNLLYLSVVVEEEKGGTGGVSNTISNRDEARRSDPRPPRRRFPPPKVGSACLWPVAVVVVVVVFVFPKASGNVRCTIRACNVLRTVTVSVKCLVCII